MHSDHGIGTSVLDPLLLSGADHIDVSEKTSSPIKVGSWTSLEQPAPKWIIEYGRLTPPSKPPPSCPSRITAILLCDGPRGVVGRLGSSVLGRRSAEQMTTYTTTTTTTATAHILPDCLDSSLGQPRIVRYLATAERDKARVRCLAVPNVSLIHLPDVTGSRSGPRRDPKIRTTATGSEKHPVDPHPTGSEW